MSSRPALVLGAALAAATLAAGCGGNDDETSATEAWASGVCSAITTWSDSTRSATEALTGEGSAGDRLDAAISDVQDATTTLVDDLEDLGVPETDAGQEAQDLVEALADDLEENLDTIEDAADSSDGASETLTAISTISATLVTMGSQASSTFEELQQVDAGGELSDAFDQADSCDSLRSSS
jgi:hypothetical protein